MLCVWEVAAMHGRILVIDERVPTPDQDSGSADTFSYLQILARAGFEVIFAPHKLAPRAAYRRILDHLGVTSSARYLSTLKRIGVKPLTAPRWTSINSVVEKVRPTCDLLLHQRQNCNVLEFLVAGCRNIDCGGRDGFRC
jgi:hypothetical protein